MFYVIYRLSDSGSGFPQHLNIDKMTCFRNFMDVFQDTKIVVIADNCSQLTISKINKYPLEIIETSLGNSGSLKYAFDFALQNYLYENDVVYFVEDDFLHLKGSKELLLEGLSLAHYASLYDHLDKYMDPSQNPYIKGGGEITKVMLTRNSHWKITNSTTQTFCTRMGTLRADKEILYKYNFKGDMPDSFNTFIELNKNKRILVTCIPGNSTTVDSFMSPLISWNDVIKKYRGDDFIGKTHN
uniref:Glycosyltransferase n=1 Tax=viral metagenome TaxID=1070528 RepID=A0A6M3XG30_9ZZZZ